MHYKPSRELVLDALGRGKPLSTVEAARATGLSRSQAGSALFIAWQRSLILRTAEPIYQVERVNKGRAGAARHIRPYHLYLAKPKGVDEVKLGERRFVSFSEEYMDPRGGGGVSKTSRVFEFIKQNAGSAFYSSVIAERLVDHGVKPRDVMTNVRRWEARGLVYVRGYKGEERETPFREGYLVTFIEQEKPRNEAVSEAVVRTDKALAGAYSGSPIMERVMRTRDIVIEHSQLRKLVSFAYIHEKLGCTPDQSEKAVTRALQLYPSLRELKLFDAYRYYHCESLGGEELSAAVEMKKNYLRIAKGRANRIGHNWEATAEWFIDKFTSGARFWTQQHRDGGMDSRRINVHLLKGVGGRRSIAELDRVWEVTPGVFAPPVTYVLSCKWGVVSKKHMDDFMEVLRWSKDFGVDTPNGRETRQGVVGVFAAGAFNPREHVEVKAEKVTLPQYAARRNLQIVTAPDFNEKMREKGCGKGVTVQKLCRLAGNEADVRAGLDAIWKEPEKAESVFTDLLARNEELYRFEKMLEGEEERADD